ncbi:ribosomal L7Ae/L30e/S12e/Gadd45 family protein [Candidatus Woesearchaeota archaeon]|nr:ribosomal L7Ae/L30e/S12e/Gadd45 family protein [Candidatus Woesearchaeota archaeon]
MSVEDLKKAIKEEKLTFGAEETIRKLKLGKIKTVFIAKDCKASYKDRILDYKKQGNIKVLELDISESEIGTLCKKQFSISMLSY